MNISHDLNISRSSGVNMLIYEMVYQRYRIARDDAERLFGKLSIAEFISLYFIVVEQEAAESYQGRVYLNDIAERAGISLRKTSEMIRKMRDKGLVSWQHDGDGQDGTYVSVTEYGMECLKEAEAELQQLFGAIIENFGKEKVVELISLMKQLDTVMNSILDR